MPTASPEIEQLLAQDFFERHPEEAADHLEISTPSEAAEILSHVAPEASIEAFRRLSPVKALDMLAEINLNYGRQLIHNLDPPQAGALLGGLDTQRCDDLLAGLAPAEAKELHSLMQHPVDSAGRLMDPRIAVFRPDMTAEEALERLRSIRHRRRMFDLLVVDSTGRLSGTVPLQEVVLAESEATLLPLVKGASVAVSAFTTHEEIVETMERHKLTSIPVVDYDNKPLGIIRLNELVSAVEEELSADLVSITGASKEERALSKVRFAIRKRLPWLQINLAPHSWRPPWLGSSRIRSPGSPRSPSCCRLWPVNQAIPARKPWPSFFAGLPCAKSPCATGPRSLPRNLLPVL